ncbi:hypothetical protein EsH8_VIII_000053 [Colletotrichum jinshuiense]
MLKTLLVLGLSASALAADALPVLFKRQSTCGQAGRKDCGDGCIPLTYTCCPDAQGGCPVTSTCWLGTNGQYGCCPIGRRCTGPGGVNTLPGVTVTSTIAFTETVPDVETSTFFFEPTTTSTSTFVFTSEIETEIESTSTILFEPETTTKSVSTTTTRRTIVASPTTTPSSTTTGTPPATVNAAKIQRPSLLQGIAAAAMALFVI